MTILIIGLYLFVFLGCFIVPIIHWSDTRQEITPLKVRWQFIHSLFWFPILIYLIADQLWRFSKWIISDLISEKPAKKKNSAYRD